MVWMHQYIMSELDTVDDMETALSGLGIDGGSQKPGHITMDELRALPRTKEVMRNILGMKQAVGDGRISSGQSSMMVEAGIRLSYINSPDYGHAEQALFMRDLMIHHDPVPFDADSGYSWITGNDTLEQAIAYASWDTFVFSNQYPMSDNKWRIMNIMGLHSTMTHNRNPIWVNRVLYAINDDDITARLPLADTILRYISDSINPQVCGALIAQCSRLTDEQISSLHEYDIDMYLPKVPSIISMILDGASHHDAHVSDHDIHDAQTYAYHASSIYECLHNIYRNGMHMRPNVLHILLKWGEMEAMYAQSLHYEGTWYDHESTAYHHHDAYIIRMLIDDDNPREFRFELMRGKCVS